MRRSSVMGISSQRTTTLLEFAVPELTRSADIKLIKWISLRRPSNQLSISYRNCPCPAHEAEPPGDYIPPGGSVGSRSMREVAERPKGFQLLGVSPKPAWAEVWHLWRVILPRRSISGRLVRGQVWRRHDGRRWIYKEFTEYRD